MNSSIEAFTGGWQVRP